MTNFGNSEVGLHIIRYMKPVKREMVTLPELRPGDTCILSERPDFSLVVKVVEVRATENSLFYVPAVFNAVGVPEFIAADKKVCSSTFPPGKRIERVELEAGAQ